MKINKWLLLAGFGYYFYQKGKSIVNALHTRIVKVQIEDFWANLSRGKYKLRLIWLLDNQSTEVVTMYDFKGAFRWQNFQMANIYVNWANQPIPPRVAQEIPFVVEGDFAVGFAAIVLAMHNPGNRLLEGCTINGLMRGALNRMAFELPIDQEIKIIL